MNPPENQREVEVSEKAVEAALRSWRDDSHLHSTAIALKFKRALQAAAPVLCVQERERLGFTCDDANRLGAIADELEHLPPEIRRTLDQDGRDARFLRLKQQQILDSVTGTALDSIRQQAAQHEQEHAAGFDDRPWDKLPDFTQRDICQQSREDLNAILPLLCGGLEEDENQRGSEGLRWTLTRRHSKEEWVGGHLNANVEVIGDDLLRQTMVMPVSEHREIRDALLERVERGQKAEQELEQVRAGREAEELRAEGLETQLSQVREEVERLRGEAADLRERSVANDPDGYSAARLRGRAQGREGAADRILAILDSSPSLSGGDESSGVVGEDDDLDEALGKGWRRVVASAFLDLPATSRESVLRDLGCDSLQQVRARKLVAALAAKLDALPDTSLSGDEKTSNPLTKAMCSLTTYEVGDSGDVEERGEEDAEWSRVPCPCGAHCKVGQAFCPDCIETPLPPTDPRRQQIERDVKEELRERLLEALVGEDGVFAWPRSGNSLLMDKSSLASGVNRAFAAASTQPDSTTRLSEGTGDDLDNALEMLQKRRLAIVEHVEQLQEFDAWLSFRPEFAEVLRAFRSAFGTDTSAVAPSRLSKDGGEEGLRERLAQEFDRRVEKAKRVRADLKPEGRAVLDACIAERQKAADLCRSFATNQQPQGGGPK